MKGDRGTENSYEEIRIFQEILRLVKDAKQNNHVVRGCEGGDS